MLVDVILFINYKNMKNEVFSWKVSIYMEQNWKVTKDIKKDFSNPNDMNEFLAKESNYIEANLNKIIKAFEEGLKDFSNSPKLKSAKSKMKEIGEKGKKEVLKWVKKVAQKIDKSID